MANLDLVQNDLIQGMGIRFWFHLIENLNISSIIHCQHVIKFLQDILNDINKDVIGDKKVFDNNLNNIQDMNDLYDQDEVRVIILVLGIKFWQNIVEKQNIVDIKHGKVIINYLQGFIGDISDGSKVDFDVQKTEKEIKCEEFEYDNGDDMCNINADMCNDDDVKDGFDDFIPASSEDTIKPKILRRSKTDNSYNPYKSEDDSLSKQEKILKKIERAKTRPRKLTVSTKYHKNDRIYRYEQPIKIITIHCDYCAETFPSVYIASQHVTGFHPEKLEEFDKKYKIYECTKPDCDKVYYTVKSLHCHYRETHKLKVKNVSIHARGSLLKDKDFRETCVECNKVFKFKSSYEDHMKEHRVGLGTKLYKCEICKRRFHYRTQLRNHTSYRGESESTLCSKCGESFNSKCDLVVHRKKHEKESSKEKKKFKSKIPKKCNYCDVVCETYHKALKHMFQFHDHSAIFCDICGHKAMGQKDLNRHLETHIEGLNVKCEHCGRGFKSQRNLDRHIKTVHTSDDSKTFKCQQCGKGFLTNSYLSDHMNMHLGLKPYKCEFCGAAYQNKSNLLAHKKKSCKAIAS